MIYVVTPVYNRINFTIKYLEALKNQTYKDFKIVIVDDGSTDGTPEVIRLKYPDVILFEEEGDLWWAESTNIGVRYALQQNAEYILTLNDDTLPKPDFIEKMVFWSQREPKALLGALSIDHDTKKIMYGGEIHDFKNRVTTRVYDTLPADSRKGLHMVNIYPGRGLLIPAEVFNEIGLYDSKNFPQTVSDLDFTCRAIRYGYKIFCNYDAQIEMFPDESAASRLRKNKSLKNYFTHLFGKTGGGNLLWFIKFGIRNCPRKYLFLYLLRGIAGRILGYWIKV